MDPSQIDSLVHRLVADPHDEEALAFAHQAGVSDPKSYALLLERVGVETPDAGYASHWLSEAANVWSTTLGDAHRAARVLMQAIDRDPTQRTPADRLAQLYRDKGDIKALVALLERRAKALAPLVPQSSEIRSELAAMHEELGRLWSESLQQPKKALENFRRTIELDPSSAYAVYGAREIYKSLGQWDDAFKMYEVAVSLERDPASQLALLREEAEARRAAGDLAGVTGVFARARQIDGQDPGLQQEYSASIVDRIAAGEGVPSQERTLGAELLVGLAEAYDGEHGLAYSGGALDIEPGHDRALQLYAHYARAIEREDDVATRYLAYVEANPNGPMAPDARWILAGSYEGAGQYPEAIRMLEPLRSAGDEQAAAKLRELYQRAGQRMPSVPPPLPQQPPARGSPSSGSVRRAPMAADKMQAALEAAQTLASSGRRPDAYRKFREVLASDPAHPEALSWVQDYLRTKRDYAPLRDVLLAAMRAPGESVESRRDRLREIAGLCEGNLRDVDGAINAYKQILSLDRTDESARQSLTRMLEKHQRWDDLANMLEQEANAEVDLEKKIGLEKKLATLHEQKRKDLAAAADAWERIANLTPEDDQAITTAVKMFEKAGAIDRAAQVIAANAPSVTDAIIRGGLLERLGELREKLNDPTGAGEAYQDAAEVRKTDALWEAAERCFVASELWDRAGQAAVQRAELAGDATHQAPHFARSADYFGRAGDEPRVFANLERATELDPANDPYAQLLSDRYTVALRWSDLVEWLLKRAAQLTDKTKRVEARRQAANLYVGELADKDAARETWRKILDDGEDRDALDQLVNDAIERADYAEATELLQRLEKVAVDVPEKVRIALRQAELIAENVGDVEDAIFRYERILGDLDPTCRQALQAIADLHEASENPAAAATALERELKIVSDAAERGTIANRLARLYEQLDESENAVRVLEIVRAVDPDDFDALTRLSELCEKTEKWARLAELLAQRIEVEADDMEMSALTRRLASVLADKLERGDEALAALADLADEGDAAVRAAYIELGDRLGWRGIVATKLVEWWLETPPGSERTGHLRGAFDRFVEVGRDADAVRVGCELVRAKGADRAMADQLEQLSIKTHDLDALSMAHDFIARELSGVDRARELVRQAEARAAAGSPPTEALQHGEGGLTSVPPAEAEELLTRLAAIAEKPSDVVDLYERQVARCKSPADRVLALARAAQVASAHGQIDRARPLFELALSGAPSDEALEALEQAARDGDARKGGDELTRALCTAFAGGGQGARDGGRTRGALLRRAASITFDDLKDEAAAFTLLGDSLIAHVDPQTLDALEDLARDAGDLRRAEATLSRALEEVFDGPLVRQLLARRAKLRREQLADPTGAAADLKKLHDLSPNDQPVLDELSALLTELGDFRGMVQVFEDQILRGKDLSARADLARKVARMWEDKLSDPREAADAWRRVLRMKQGDAEATAGLERAKSNMLRTLEPSSERRRESSQAEDVPPRPRSEPPARPADLPVGEAEATTGSTETDEARDPAAALAQAEEPSPPEAEEKQPSVESMPPPPDVHEPLAQVAPTNDLAASTVEEPPPPLPVAAASASELDLPIDVEESGEHVPVDSEEIVLGDDAEDIIDVMDAGTGAAPKEPEKPPVAPKRSIPPPLPRT